MRRVYFDARDVTGGRFVAERDQIIEWLEANGIASYRTWSIDVRGRFARVTRYDVDDDGEYVFFDDHAKMSTTWHWLRVPFPKELL